jgi:hypothetical protein
MLDRLQYSTARHGTVQYSAAQQSKELHRAALAGLQGVTHIICIGDWATPQLHCGQQVGRQCWVLLSSSIQELSAVQLLARPNIVGRCGPFCQKHTLQMCARQCCIGHTHLWLHPNEYEFLVCFPLHPPPPQCAPYACLDDASCIFLCYHLPCCYALCCSCPAAFCGRHHTRPFTGLKAEKTYDTKKYRSSVCCT